MAVAVRYVNRELVAIFFVALLVLLGVAVGGRFIGYLQEAAIGKMTGSTVLVIMLYRLPEFLQLIMPFALYVGVLLTLSRLYADREMVVLQSAGATTLDVTRWAGLTASIVVLVLLALTTVVTPFAKRELEVYLNEQRAKSEFDTVNPGEFHRTRERLTYSEGMSDDRRTLYEVFLAENIDQDERATVWARSARQELDVATGSRFLILKDGYRYNGAIGAGDYQVLKFDELRQRLELSTDLERELDVAAKPMFELSAAPEEVAEFHWRIALPVFALVGSVLAVGLARVRPRQGRFAKVVPAMIVMLLYYLLLLAFQHWLTEGDISGTVGMWPVHALFAVGGLALLARVGRPV